MLNFFRRLKLRLIWSWAGCMFAWRNEHSFRSWVWANLASASLALWLPLTSGERGLILALGILVMAFELLNTAVEQVVDYISEEQHPRAGAAKDCGSGAVFVSSLAAGATWLVVLWRLILG